MDALSSKICLEEPRWNAL